MHNPNAGKLVTIFGGSGFVGRQVVRRLAKDGYRIRVATRKPNLRMDLKPSGDVGQIALIKADVRDESQVREAVRGASHVVNLVGILRPGGGQNFSEIHVASVTNIAKACVEFGVDRFVQFSSIGADLNSKAAYAKSRAEGETAARAAVPACTVLRPSVVFGSGDGFFSMFAGMMRWARGAFFSFGGGVTKFQPVYVGDVAEVVSVVLSNPNTKSKTYELGGPAVYSLHEILQMISTYTDRNLALIPLPFFVLDVVALLFGWLPFSPITYDQAKLLRKDNVVKAGPDAASVGTFADLGIKPTNVEAVVPAYLAAFRPTGQYIQHGQT